MKSKIVYIVLIVLFAIYTIDISVLAGIIIHQFDTYINLNYNWYYNVFTYVTLSSLLLFLGSIISVKKYKGLLLIITIIFLPANLYIILHGMFYDVFFQKYAVTNIILPESSSLYIEDKLGYIGNIIVLILIAVFPFLIIWKLKPVKLNKYYIAAVFFTAFIFVMVLSYKNTSSINNFPIINLVYNHNLIKKNKSAVEDISKQISNKDINLTVKLSDNTKHIFILVIGGCQDKSHFSVYGYNRNTMPQLNELKDKLLLFNNVFIPESPQNILLSQMITLGYNEAHNKDAVNIIDVFKNAGFRTYWLSNHNIYDNDSIYSSAVGLSADEYVFTNNKLYIANSRMIVNDEALIPYYEKIMSEEYSRKFIVFNLDNSCDMEMKNTSDEYDYFYSKYADADEGKINDYDNTVVQTDYVLNRIIEGLEISNSESYMLYTTISPSLVEEDERLKNNIPFILWLSEEYKKSYPETVEAGKENLDKVYKVDALINSLLDLSQIKYINQDENKSIFSKSYKENNFPADKITEHEK